MDIVAHARHHSALGMERSMWVRLLILWDDVVSFQIHATLRRRVDSSILSTKIRTNSALGYLDGKYDQPGNNLALFLADIFLREIATSAK